MPKHASASLAVLDLVMASPAQPAARRSPRRLCLLSARSDDQPLPRSDQKGKTKQPLLHAHTTRRRGSLCRVSRTRGTPGRGTRSYYCECGEGG